MADKKNKKKSKKPMDSVLAYGKIYARPVNVQQTIPYKQIFRNGIIETRPGVFTKCYRIPDVNFKVASQEEQIRIFNKFGEFLNSFNENIRWQIMIYNRSEDKKETMKNIRILPQGDGLNKYRKDMNNILLEKMVKGNNSITQEKYLVVSIEDNVFDMVNNRFAQLDGDIAKMIRNITKIPTTPLTTEERLELLHSIYNMDGAPFFNGVDENGDGCIDYDQLAKQGLTTKDMVAPDSFDFSPGNYFKMGDTFGQSLYVKTIPTFLNTDYISDIADIACNQIISMHYMPIEAQKAMDMIKTRLASIDAQIASSQKKNLEDGYIGASISPQLEHARNTANSIMEDIVSHNQKLYLVGITVTVFADTKEALEENVLHVMAAANKHVCPLKKLTYQQEQGLNSALPLGVNELFTDRMHTTESACAFMPFNSQELMHKHAIFYGLNSITKHLIVYDRLRGSNANGMIFGQSGSGKSMIAKWEMISVLLKDPDAQIFVIDPQGEYYPMARNLGGEVIQISPTSTQYINPLDMDINYDEDDPISMKSDYVISMCEIMLSGGYSLEPVTKSIIDRCVRKIYKHYVEYMNNRLDKSCTCDPAMSPTLNDLYLELCRQPEPQAHTIADIIEMYATGSYNAFAHRTNVETNSRFTVYDIKKLGSGMRNLGLHVCINDIWNRMIENSKKGIHTWFWIDEFHLLLQSDSVSAFMQRIFKMARKWLGVPTGILQNTEDLLRTSDARGILNNTDFIIMMSLQQMDRQNIADLLGASDDQLEYINGCEKGHGLIRTGNIIIPFENEVPKNSSIYRMTTTAHDVNDEESFS